MSADDDKAVTEAAEVTALAALGAEDFEALVRTSLSRDVNGVVWKALMDAAVIGRTKLMLDALLAEAESELGAANAAAKAAGRRGRDAYFGELAAQETLRANNAALLRLVKRRLALIKSRTPQFALRVPGPTQQPHGSKVARQRYAEALEKLARAVASHRDHVLSGDGGEDDDDDLWDCLDQIMITDGNGGEQSLDGWLGFLDKAREAS